MLAGPLNRRDSAVAHALTSTPPHQLRLAASAKATAPRLRIRCGSATPPAPLEGEVLQSRGHRIRCPRFAILRTPSINPFEIGRFQWRDAVAGPDDGFGHRLAILRHRIDAR